MAGLRVARYAHRGLEAIGLWPKDSSSSLIFRVLRFGVPTFRPPVFCPRVILLISTLEDSDKAEQRCSQRLPVTPLIGLQYEYSPRQWLMLTLLAASVYAPGAGANGRGGEVWP